MRDILDALQRWQRDGQEFVLATVVDTRRSAPRPAGAAMAVSAGGEVAGSVSGGCVEGAVFESAQDVLRSGVARSVSFGFSDEDAFAVGLTCGGEIDLFLEPVAPTATVATDVLQSIAADEPIAIATVVAGRERVGAKRTIRPSAASGTLGNEGPDVAVTDDARGMLELGQTGLRHYGQHGERRVDKLTVFVQSFAPRPRMLVFGAIDFAAAVARIGTFLGYRVTVCDARETFATPARFPDADEVVVAWPHRYLADTAVDARTVICVLTHDPKFDVPLLEVALRTPAAYIGAMGSRRTHTQRLAELRDRGVSDGDLRRLRSPVGLDLGARTPEETALSIAAEIVKDHWGGSGLPLRETDGRIHGPATDESAPATP